MRDLARGIGHDQFPAYYDELLGPFYFAPPGTAIPAHAPTVTKADPMRADFDLAREMNTVAAYDAFIERYGEKKGEFTVQMAMQLRDNLRVKPAEAPTPPRETPPAVLPQDGTRETIRRTQEALNAAGCEAGVADGVIGRRTRAAFARFAGLAGKNKSLQLGSAAALAAMQEDIRNGVKCETVAAPAPAPDVPTEAPAFTLAGTWHFTAKCPLFVTTTGTIRLRSQGGGRFVGTMRDSLGQTANISSLLNGRDFTSTEAFPNLQAKSWGQLSADGRRYSATTSVGCKVHARKG